LVWYRFINLAANNTRQSIAMVSETLTQYIRNAQKGFEGIPAQREATLAEIASYIRQQRASDSPVALNMICTHNSRRSHLAQIWAQVAAYYYGVSGITCYSGGTEATAMYPMIVQTLQAAGLQVVALSQGNNPVYAVKYAQHAAPVICFSKEFDHPFNIQNGFAAVMTCSDADQNCPYIPTATHRFRTYYNDPKISDGTPEQTTVYAERCLQIATEMIYVFDLLVA